MNDLPPLHRLHSDALIESRRYRSNLIYWRAQSTKSIVDSLSATAEEPLLVRSNGLIVQGNTRTRVLEERGFDINTLPRTIV